MTHPQRPGVGTHLTFRWRKWDGSPHWVHDCVYLGSDEWGDWLGQRPGWSSARPGREMEVIAPSITLVPPSGDFAYTHNALPMHTRVYIDLGWDLRWEDGEPVGIDMDLDVVRRDPDDEYIDRDGILRQPGDVYIEDRDEWDEHRVQFGYPSAVVERLEELAVDLERRVAASEPPFDDATAARWLARLDSIG